MGLSGLVDGRTDALALAFEGATGDAVVVLDRALRVARWSAVAAAILGRPAESVLGEPASSALPLPSRAVDEAGPFELIARGEAWAGTWSPDPDGGVQLGIEAQPVHDRQGRFDGAVVFVRPSVREAPERPAEERRAALLGFEGAMEQIAVLDRHRRVLAVNEAFQRSVERARGRRLALGEDMLAVAAPGTESAFLEGFDRALQGEGVRRLRSVRFPNGSEFDHLVEYAPIAEDGRVTGVLFGSVLIHELRERVEEGRLLDRALAGAPVAVLIADARRPDLPIVYASRSLELLA